MEQLFHGTGAVADSQASTLGAILYIRRAFVANIENGRERVTRWIRRIARIWSLVVIGITLVVLIAHVVVPEPEAMDYPPSENLLPLAMCLSVAGLGVAWRWEGLGGTINVGFFLTNVGLYWLLRGRFFPLRGIAVLSPAVVPGVLFLVCWWRTRSRGALRSA